MTSATQAPSTSDVPVNHLEGLDSGQVYAQLTRLLSASTDESLARLFPGKDHGRGMRVEVFSEDDKIVIRVRGRFTGDEWTINSDGRIVKAEFHRQ